MMGSVVSLEFITVIGLWTWKSVIWRQNLILTHEIFSGASSLMCISIFRTRLEPYMQRRLNGRSSGYRSGTFFKAKLHN